MFRLNLLLVFKLFILAVSSLGGTACKSASASETSLGKMISDAFTAAKSQSAPERFNTLTIAAKSVQEKAPNNVLVAEQLQAATDSESLEKALRYAYDMLTYRIALSGEMPDGFPEPTPVGEIQVKNYPVYRLARTASENSTGFFKLFAHIKVNRIEMTTPVEMTYSAESKNAPKQIEMAFLYGNTDLGKAGNKLGGITVQDIPALTTVSIGLKGEVDAMNVSEAERRLVTWLEQLGTDYERAGNLRVLGYNGPDRPADLRYFEVELPIRKKGLK